MICAGAAQGAAGGSNGSVCEEDHCAGCDAIYPAGGGNWFRWTVSLILSDCMVLHPTRRYTSILRKLDGNNIAKTYVEVFFVTILVLRSSVTFFYISMFLYLHTSDVQGMEELTLFKVSVVHLMLTFWLSTTFRFRAEITNLGRSNSFMSLRTEIGSTGDVLMPVLAAVYECTCMRACVHVCVCVFTYICKCVLCYCQFTF